MIKLPFYYYSISITSLNHLYVDFWGVNHTKYVFFLFWFLADIWNMNTCKVVLRTTAIASDVLSNCAMCVQMIAQVVKWLTAFVGVDDATMPAKKGSTLCYAEKREWPV